MTSTLFNWICWGLFGLVWISGGIYNSYKAPATMQKRFRYDSLVIAVLALMAMRYVPLHFQTVMKFHIPWLQVSGMALLLLSTLFTVWSRWVLGKMWANHAAVKTEHKLVTNGPYRMTRHPIYTGILGMILGSAFSSGEGIVFIGFVILLLFFLNRIRLEEQLMTQTFGDQYLNYKNRVPKLVPGLHR